MLNPSDIENAIHFGDCLDLLRQLPDQSVDLVLTDPPYGIGLSERASWGGEGLAKNRRWNTSEWDSVRPGVEYFAELLRVGKKCIIFGGNYFADLLPPSSCWLVWDKLTGNNKFADCELAWTSLPGAVRKFTHRQMGFITDDAQDAHARIHPAQKPIKLIAAIIERYSEQGDLVLYPFAGSGTTGVAAYYARRRYCLVERDPEYFASASARLSSALRQPLLL